MIRASPRCRDLADFVVVEVFETPGRVRHGGVGCYAAGEFGAPGVKNEVAQADSGHFESRADLVPVLLEEHRLRNDEHAADIVENLGRRHDQPRHGCRSWKSRTGIEPRTWRSIAPTSSVSKILDSGSRRANSAAVVVFPAPKVAVQPDDHAGRG
ncbi:hypothetical protein [Nocardia niigatensis]|uniref:hypothetical protein n=1 Tax=Nocardia niigatensis TaxID=209249 RepID=UPI0012F70219|nr:hypothetical protein [Nocardia niigatensis]